MIYDVLVLTSLVYDWLFLSTYVACHLCFLLRLLFCFCFIDFCMSVLCDSLWKWFIGRHEYSVTFFFNFENLIFRKIIKWYKILTFFPACFPHDFQKNITGICSCWKSVRKDYQIIEQAQMVFCCCPICRPETPLSAWNLRERWRLPKTLESLNLKSSCLLL